MTQQIPQPDALPSTRTLLRSTAIAAAVALALLCIVVLPAEYGIDPTGLGRVLGFAEMGETKASLEQEAKVAADRAPSAVVPCAPAATPAAPAAPANQPATTAGSAIAAVAPATTHVTQVTLGSGEGKEVKLTMRAGARVTFSWSTDRGVVNYDLHSDNPSSGAYHGYGKGKGLRTHEGVLVAAFDGSHGWFWRNRGAEPVTITLKTSGDYEEVKELSEP